MRRNNVRSKSKDGESFQERPPSNQLRCRSSYPLLDTMCHVVASRGRSQSCIRATGATLGYAANFKRDSRPIAVLLPPTFPANEVLPPMLSLESSTSMAPPAWGSRKATERAQFELTFHEVVFENARELADGRYAIGSFLSRTYCRTDVQQYSKHLLIQKEHTVVCSGPKHQHFTAYKH